jgi:transcriptional regulator with XRE-family HTH domain
MYETGANRISAGRLYRVAIALDVEVGYFFMGAARQSSLVPSPQQRQLGELLHNLAPHDRRHRKALRDLARL